MSGTSRIDVSALVASLVPLLVMGITLFLALGCLVMRMTRSPVHRQRLGEMTLLGALMWSVLAFIPLPRLLPDLSSQFPDPATESTDNNARHSVMPALAGFRLDGTQAPHEPRQLTWGADPAKVNAQLSELNQLLTTAAETGLAAEVIRADPVPVIPGSIAQHRQPPLGVSTRLPTHSSMPPGSAARASEITSLGILAGLYLAGVSACILWLTVGQVLLLRIRQQAQRPEPWLEELFRSLQPKSLVNSARLIVSGRCARAMSWGIWRPIIALPQALSRRQNAAQLRTILLHELGHVAQRDAWGNLLICCTLPLLYLHPLFWWLRVQIRLAAELIADDWAAQQTGKEAYVEELVALAKVTAGRGILLPGVTGVLSSPSQFYRRMNMLLAREEPLTTRPTAAWRIASLGAWIVAVGLAASLAGIQPAVGQGTPESPATEGASPPATPPATESPKDLPPPALPAPFTPTTVPAPPVATPPVDARNPQPATSNPAQTPALPGTSIETERARLRAELQQIQSRLKALDEGTPPASRVPTLKSPLGGKSVTVIRVDADGRTVTETWSVDESGKPAKLIDRDQTGQYLPNVIYATPQARAATVVAEPRIENGKSVLHYYVIDPNGVKREINPVEGHGPGELPVPSPYSSDKRYTAKTGTPIALPQGPPMLPRSGKSASRLPAEDQPGAYQQLDLVSLATSYADAVGAVESAKALLAEIEPLAKTATISNRELVTARITLQNAERKERLLRRIAASATANVKHQFEQLKALYERGAASSGELQEVEGRLEILNQILETQPAGDTKTSDSKPVLPPASTTPKSSY